MLVFYHYASRCKMQNKNFSLAKLNNEILLEVLKFIDIISINFDRIIHIHDDEIDNNEWLVRTIL